MQDAGLAEGQPAAEAGTASTAGTRPSAQRISRSNEKPRKMTPNGGRATRFRRTFVLGSRALRRSCQPSPSVSRIVLHCASATSSPASQASVNALPTARPKCLRAGTMSGGLLVGVTRQRWCTGLYRERHAGEQDNPGKMPAARA
jgi:hypothetical protein